MTATAPDPWADAWQAATQPVLDRRLARVRRRVWLRQALVLVAGCGVILAGFQWLMPFTSALEPLWPAPRAVVRGGVALAVLGLVLVLAANARSTAKRLDRSLVGPDAYLPPSERAWVRDHITHGRSVPAERRLVVIALAERMRAEGVQSLSYAGLACLYVGLLVAQPNPVSLVVFAALTATCVVRVSRALLWSGRARRWLALHP